VPSGARSPEAGHGARPGAGAVTLLVAAYSALHVVVRLLAGPGLQHDEAEQLVLGQGWALGYGLQPPLYTWLHLALFSTVGVTVLSVTLLRNLALTALYLFCFLAARRILADTRLAALAALSLWLVPQVAWESYRDLSHTVLAMAVAAATLWLLLRLAAEPSTGLYAALGVLLGLGLLSKYTYLLFAGALLAAAAFTRGFRAAVADRRLLLSAGIAAAVAAPHLGWVVDHLDALAALVPGELHIESVWSPGARVTGLLVLAASVLGFLLGPAVALAVFVPGSLLRGSAAAPPAGRLLSRYLAIAVGSLALGVLLFGIPTFRPRWAQSVLFLAPLALFARAAPALRSARRLRALTVVIGLAGLLSLLLRLGEGWLPSMIGLPTRFHVPVAPLAARFRAAGFAGGTIVSPDLVLAGNLRLAFPDSRVVVLESFAAAPGPAPPGPCLVVWPAARTTVPPPAIEKYLAQRDQGALALSQPLLAEVASDARAQSYRAGFFLLNRSGRC